MTIEQFARDLRAGAVSSRHVVEECLGHIDARNGALNAFILVMHDEARRQAAEADRELTSGIDRGPLHGVPVSVKDLIDVRGTSTTAASRVREGHRAPADAPIIRRLRRAGAVIVGKTNLHEFAFGTTNEESAFGPARHPVDPTRSPGGSSGGSAISILAGMALGSVGTDTGGSIRIPAAACGVVGLKPGYGEVPSRGVVPLSPTLDHVGPLAASVGDAAILYRTLAGAGASQALSATLRNRFRLGIPRRYFFDLLDDEVRHTAQRGIDAIAAAGSRLEDVDLGHAPVTAPAYLHIVFPEAAAYHAGALEAMPDRYTRPVRLRLELARYVLAEDYVRALAVREVLRRQVNKALAGRDALLLPTLPIPAPVLGAQSVDIGGTKQPVRNLMLRLTQLFNLTGHPAISIPCGQTASGLPVGLQLVGHAGSTDALLEVAAACERTLHDARPA